MDAAAGYYDAAEILIPGGGIDCGAGCIDTQTDPANCGGCGDPCAPGQTCAAGACSCGSMSVSFSGTVQPLLTASCASNGCHKGVNPQQGLDLTAANAYQDLVNVPTQQCNDGRKRVLPGNAEQLRPAESLPVSVTVPAPVPVCVSVTVPVPCPCPCSCPWCELGFCAALVYGDGGAAGGEAGCGRGPGGGAAGAGGGGGPGENTKG